jgi:hypothetical protein
MTVEEILPNLFLVQRGYLNANHFVFRGDRPVLIDTAYLAHFDQTKQIISALGVDLLRPPHGHRLVSGNLRFFLSGGVSPEIR